MSIGPEDIERAVFKERFRGYDQDQVDRFLDQVAAAMTALRAERDQLAAQAGALPAGAPPAAGEGVESVIKRTLQAAQRSAEDLVSDARRHAAEILHDARERAERDREQVALEGDLVRRAAGELASFRDEYRSRLHAIMSEQLAALDRAGELPRLPPAVERVAGAAAPARSPARAWAEAAAGEPEEPEEAEEQGRGGRPEADPEREDALSSPWDELWRSSPTAAGAEQAGADASGAAADAEGDLPRPGPAAAEHAGDA